MTQEDALQIADIVRGIIQDVIRSPTLPTYLSTKTAAEVAGVTQGTIRRWVKAGELREYRAGADLRVRLSDLEAYLARHEPENVVDLDARVRNIMG